MRISDWSSDVCSSDLGLRLCAGLPLGAPWQVASEYIAVVGRLHGLAIMANALSPCQGGVKAILVAINNRLRTGTDWKKVVSGKSVSVRVELGGRRILKKKKRNITQTMAITIQH